MKLNELRQYLADMKYNLGQEVVSCTINETNDLMLSVRTNYAVQSFYLDEQDLERNAVQLSSAIKAEMNNAQTTDW